MKYYELDENEKDLLKEFEKGNVHRVGRGRKKYKEYARSVHQYSIGKVQQAK